MAPSLSTRNSDRFPSPSSKQKLRMERGHAEKPSEAGLGDLHGVVIWLPAFQLLEAEETLSQVGLVLRGAVDEAGRSHLQSREQR